MSGWAAAAEKNAELPLPEPSSVTEPTSSGRAFFDSQVLDHGVGNWPYDAEEHYGPFARLAEIMGISTDELWKALEDGQTLAEIAASNGMARQELVDALLLEADEYLTLAAAGGFLDDEQVTFIRDWLTDGVELAVDHPLPVGEDWWALHAVDWHALLDADDYDLPDRLTETLGLTLQELAAAVLEGQSLAEIALAQGVSPRTVVEFLVSEAEEELEEALAAGFLTEGQAGVLRAWVVDGIEPVVYNSLVLPNVFDLMERLARFRGDGVAKIDWASWADFDWSQLIGRDPLSATADSVGVSRGELLEKLSAGESLTALAEAQGVDPRVAVGALTASTDDLLDDIAEGGLFPADRLERVKTRLGPAIEFFATYGFLFAERWGESGGAWGRWHGDMELRMLERFGCCPCDTAPGGE
jgi:uncharacterized protein YidB (DUF937 family)